MKSKTTILLPVRRESRSPEDYCYHVVTKIISLRNIIIHCLVFFQFVCSRRYIFSVKQENTLATVTVKKLTHTVFKSQSNGVFTLAWSGTGTGTGKNGLYDIMQNVSHYTGTGTGKITGKNTNGCYTHFSGPENLPGDEL